MASYQQQSKKNIEIYSKTRQIHFNIQKLAQLLYLIIPELALTYSQTRSIILEQFYTNLQINEIERT